MNINTTEVRFSDKLEIGKLVFYLETDVTGFEDSEERLGKEAAEFNNVLIAGDEPFKQKEEIREFVKYTLKTNPTTSITIHTDGNNKPVGLNKFSNFNNIKYVVFGKLARSNIPMDVRINEKNWKWFAAAGANFVFDIYKEEEIDEIIMLMTILEIKKHQIYLNIKGDLDFKEMCFIAKSKGFNIYFEASQDVFTSY